MQRKDYYWYIGIVLGVFIIAGCFLWSGLFSSLEARIEDVLTTTQSTRNDVVILEIDSQTIEKIGQWPWPRATFATILRALEAAHPRGVGVDILFSDPSRYGDFDDATLTDSINALTYPVTFTARAGEIVIHKDTVLGNAIVYPLKQLHIPPTLIGHSNLITDADGVIRSVPLFLKTDRGIMHALACQVLSRAGEKVSCSHVQRVSFPAEARAIRTIPLWRVLEPGGVDVLRDTFVFIGVTAPEFHDDHFVPGTTRKQFPGVAIHAAIATMLLNQFSFSYVPWWVALGIVVLIIMGVATSFFVFRRPIVPVVISVFIFIIFVVGAILLFDSGYVFRVVDGVAAWFFTTAGFLGYRHWSTDREKRVIRNLFSKYVSHDVVARLLQHPESVTLGGEERQITVLFCDIRGFTTLAERTEPQRLMHILNKYFSAMTQIILDAGGVVDKYIGDAIMAFWGAPLDDHHHAQHALAAARRMLAVLDEVNALLQQEFGETITIGIGLYSGKAIVGNVGSEFRFDYTAIGNTVNVASRLEGQCKEYNVPLIVGDTTVDLSDEGRNGFMYLGSVLVKGKNEEVQIFTINLRG